MFSVHGGFDSIYAFYRFEVGVFDHAFFDFDAIFISIAGLDLTLKLLCKLLFKIVVIVTVSFLNFFLPFNLVQHWHHDSLYACLGVHVLRTHCVMAMFATKDVLWIPPFNSPSNPTKASMDPLIRRVQNAIQAP